MNEDEKKGYDKAIKALENAASAAWRRAGENGSPRDLENLATYGGYMAAVGYLKSTRDLA